MSWAIKVLKKIKKVNPIHPMFFLLFVWFLVSNKLTQFFAFMLALIIHEISHFLVAKKLGYKLDKFYLTPTGAKLDYQSGIFTNSDELKIALAGPISNIFLSVFLTSIWWVFPESFLYTKSVVEQSLCLGLLNLLPAYPLDGGRVVLSFLSQKFERKNVIKYLKISNLIFVIIFLILFLISCFISYNPSLLLMAIFLLCGIGESKVEGKYLLMSILKKKTKNFSRSQILYVNSSTKLYELLKKIEKNKHTIFYVELNNGKRLFVDESKIFELSLIFNLDIALEKILSKKIEK